MESQYSVSKWATSSDSSHPCDTSFHLRPYAVSPLHLVPLRPPGCFLAKSSGVLTEPLIINGERVSKYYNGSLNLRGGQ